MAYDTLQRISNAVNDKEREINAKLHGLSETELSHLRHQTNNFDNNGQGFNNQFETPPPQLSSNASAQIKEIRTRDINGLIYEINNRKAQLQNFLNDEKRTVADLERQFNANIANRVEPATLNYAKAVTKALGRLETEINVKINALAPTQEEMKLY